jgi:hypothetical protein
MPAVIYQRNRSKDRWVKRIITCDHYAVSKKAETVVYAKIEKGILSLPTET